MKKTDMQVFRETIIESRLAFKDRSGFFSLICFISPLILAIFFSIKDFDRRSIISSFIGGVISGVLWIFILVAPFLSWVFFSALIFNLSKNRCQKMISYSTSSHQNIHWTHVSGGLALTLLWLIPLFFLIEQIPVVSEQFKFILR